MPAPWLAVQSLRAAMSPDQLILWKNTELYCDPGPVANIVNITVRETKTQEILFISIEVVACLQMEPGRKDGWGWMKTQILSP